MYPTSVRATGNGAASSVARIGGMISPFPAYYLVAGGPVAQMAGLGLFGGISIAAGIAALLLPVETSGRQMADRVAPHEKHHDRTRLPA